MQSDLALMLAAIVVLVAFIVGARSFMLLQSLRRWQTELRRRAPELDAQAERCANSAAELRQSLAAGNAALERTLWSLSRIDDGAQRLAESLRRRRTGIEIARVRYVERGGRALSRTRQTVQLISRLLQLRRILSA